MQKTPLRKSKIIKYTPYSPLFHLKLNSIEKGADNLSFCILQRWRQASVFPFLYHPKSMLKSFYFGTRTSMTGDFFPFFFCNVNVNKPKKGQKICHSLWKIGNKASYFLNEHVLVPVRSKERCYVESPDKITLKCIKYA